MYGQPSGNGDFKCFTAQKRSLLWNPIKLNFDLGSETDVDKEEIQSLKKAYPAFVQQMWGIELCEPPKVNPDEFLNAPGWGTEDVETCVSGDIAFLNFDYKLVHNFSELPSIVTQAFFDNKESPYFYDYESTDSASRNQKISPNVKLILGGTSKERTFIYYELPGSPGNSHFYLNEYSTIDGLLRGKVETPMKFSNFNELKKLLTLNPFGLRLTKMQAVYLAQQKLRELEKKSGRGESAFMLDETSGVCTEKDNYFFVLFHSDPAVLASERTFKVNAETGETHLIPIQGKNANGPPYINE